MKAKVDYEARFHRALRRILAYRTPAQLRYHAFCACGAEATGYRTLGADVDVEFFCDAHELDVPLTCEADRSPARDPQEERR